MSEPRRILKFRLYPGGNTIWTDDEPRFLAVGWQGEQLVVWCEATSGDHIQTGVMAVMTDEAAPPAGDVTYLGTAQMVTANGSPFVVHVYVQRR